MLRGCGGGRPPQTSGSHSLPVVGTYGIHVLYYMSDAEAGALPMTEEVRNQIKDSLYSQLVNEAAIKLYQEKAPSMDIIQDDAAIAALDGTSTEPEATLPAGE